jgi:WD40 repeat protein
VDHYLFDVIGLLSTFCVGSFSTGSAAEEPLRPVPQVGWASVGVASPDGSLFATGTTQYGTHLIKLVSKQGDLLRTIPLSPPTDTAFSPDGQWLAACGADEGLLLNLKSCELRYLPALCGSLVAFTLDSQKVLIVRRRGGIYGRPRVKEATDEGLFVYDLNVRQSARFPVDMDVPLRLEVVPDGKTVRVIGAHGNPGTHTAPIMGKAEETIHLDTGKTERDWGPATKGWIGPGDDPRHCQLPPAEGKKSFNPEPKGFCWSEASGLCVEYGIGSPNEVVWDIRQGRFLRTLGKEIDPRTISGFLGSDAILATAWSGRESHESLVNVRTGQVSPTAVVKALTCSPGPDGKSFLVIDPRQKPSKGKSRPIRLELYHLSLNEPIYTENVDRFIHPCAWSRDGQYLACASAEGPPTVRVVSVANGKFEEISLADTMAKHVPEKPYSRIGIKVFDFDNSGQWLAVGMGDTESGLVAIANRKTRRVETVLASFPIWVTALRFVGPDRLLAGTWHGRVQLWDLRQQKPLWTTETGRDLVRFGYIPGGPYVVCGHHGQSGTVLQLENGKVHYRTSRLWGGGNLVPDNWIQPQLIGRGTYGLEIDSESMQVRLTDLSAGVPVLTFCALPDDQWIIYTPDGDWDGSEQVHDWVKFCNGLKPVSPAVAERWHRRERIEAALKQAFP